MAEKTSRASAVMGGSKKSSSSKGKGKSKGRVHRMHITRAADNRYIVSHEMDQSPEEAASAAPSPDHAINSIDELKDHVGQYMAPDEAAAGASAAAAPAPAPGQPSPQMA